MKFPPPGSPALSLVADVSRPAEATAAVNRVRANLGAVGVLIHNASSSLGEGLLATTPGSFGAILAQRRRSGGFVCARETAPDMLATGAGVMLFTGATSSVRGGGWLSFSSAKFAVRGLAQSLARELWPRGVHVAHVVIDGLIAAPRTDEEASDDEPASIPPAFADAYWHLATRDRSAGTLELDLRPHTEQFYV